jgi:hypothetical protein
MITRCRTALLLLCAVFAAAPAFATMYGEEEFLIVPKDYTPERAWPLIVVSQNQISEKQAARVPYFIVYGGTDTARILEVAKKYRIDMFRIYATGFSRSGHGLLESTWTRPDRFAAIAPVCEDMRHKAQYKRQKIDQLKYIQNTPTLLAHGNHDSFRKTGRKNYELMKAAGCPVEWLWYPGGHSPDGIYFKDITKITNFFDKHTLDPFRKKITHVVYREGATRAFWADARIGPDSLKKAYPVFHVSVEGQKISVKATEGVKKLVFHLNDKIVDMAKPVSVEFEGKIVFQGKAASPLTVTLREGAIDDRAGSPPLWEKMRDLYAKPNEIGAHDWLYLDLHTAFNDPRRGKKIARRISLDLGLRPADAPAQARIITESKQHGAMKLTEPSPALTADMKGMRHKLDCTVTATATRHGLAGTPDAVKLAKTAEATIGEVIFIKVRLTNKGKQRLVGSARLTRSPYMHYPNGLQPRDPAAFARGLCEIAGTRRLTWQFAKHRNEIGQVLGFLMLDSGGNSKVTGVTHPGKQSWWSFYAVQRAITVEPGKTADVSLVFISLPSPDVKTAKPKVPDLAKILAQLKPEALKALGK